MFDAYGDERCGREYITYGLVLVPGDKSDSVLRVLAEVINPSISRCTFLLTRSVWVDSMAG